MAEYRVRVRTGTAPAAGTSDAIAVTLVGTRGNSPRTALDRWGPDFHCGASGGGDAPVVTQRRDSGGTVVVAQ